MNIIVKINYGDLMEKKVRDLIKNYDKLLKPPIHRLDVDIGMDWESSNLTDFNMVNLNLSIPEKPANFKNTIMRHANLKRTTISGAFFNDSDLLGADMEGSILDFSDFTNANLSHSNLNNAILDNTELNNANLSFARMVNTSVRNANMENVNLNGVDISKLNGLETASFNRVNETDIKEAKLTYILLEKYFKNIGFFNRAGDFYYRKKMMEGKEYNNNDRKMKFYSNLIFKHLCGYGERPINVLIISILIILLYSLGYASLGGPEGIGEGDNIYVDSVYFSIVTFTTLGFGDLHPNASIPLMKVSAASEAYFGIILMPLFIVILTRRLIR
jgi:ion channel/pentapeptide repeat protein